MAQGGAPYANASYGRQPRHYGDHRAKSNPNPLPTSPQMALNVRLG